MTYSDKLQDPRWQKRRLEVLQRDNFTCRLCTDITTVLHIHHKKYAKEPWEVELGSLITYCKHCHSVIEYNKKTDSIIPLQILKREIDESELKLCLIYLDKDNMLYVDIYLYKKDTLFYKTTLSAALIEDIFKIIF
jgi:hypothetical protein